MAVTPLSPAEYDARLRPVRERVLRACELPCRPFADDTWRVTVIPGGLYMDADLREALGRAAASVGDTGCVMVEQNPNGFHTPPLWTGWDEESWQHIRSGTVLGHVDVDAFADSGAWAMAIGVEDFVILGGTYSFMEAFGAALPGGWEELRARFEESVAEGEISFGEIGLRVTATLARMAGWG